MEQELPEAVVDRAERLAELGHCRHIAAVVGMVDKLAGEAALEAEGEQAVRPHVE